MHDFELDPELGEKQLASYRTLLGQLIKFEYGLWIRQQNHIDVKFPDFDNFTVVMNEKFLFLGNSHISIQGYTGMMFPTYSQMIQEENYICKCRQNMIRQMRRKVHNC